MSCHYSGPETSVFDCPRERDVVFFLNYENCLRITSRIALMWIVDSFLRVWGAHSDRVEILICCTADCSYRCLLALLRPVPLFGGYLLPAQPH